MSQYITEITPPVFVGGVGGSGTRVLAILLQMLDYHIGEDVNNSLDNMWFTALFKRRAICTIGNSEFERLYAVFRAVSSGTPSQIPIGLREIETAMLDPREQHSLSWLHKRKTSLVGRLTRLKSRPVWAWKEPNSHIVAQRILAVDSEIRYIHLARNGLDMALSGNQRQLRFWGHLVDFDNRSEITPTQSLSYWCWAEQRARQLCEKYPRRVLWVRYEDLCHDTRRTGKEIARFLGFSGAIVVKHLEHLIEPPLTIGRFRQIDRNCFQEKDLQFVASLGFPTV